MLLHDYTPFVDAEPSMVLADRHGTARWALTFKTIDRVSGAAALWCASDSADFEIVLDARGWLPNATMVTCIDCDGDGCDECRGRGWQAVDFTEQLLVVGSDGTLHAIHYRRDDFGRPLLGQPQPCSVERSRLVEWLRDAALSKVPLPEPTERLVSIWKSLHMGGAYTINEEAR